MASTRFDAKGPKYGRGGGRLLESRFARRLGIVVFTTLVFALALASSALRWRPPGVAGDPVPELTDERAQDADGDEPGAGGKDHDSSQAQGRQRQEGKDVSAGALADADDQDSGASQLTTYETSDALEATAEELVGQYEDQGCCLMRRSGYLDLFGRVWSCVVEGPGWVDVCTVCERADALGSQVRICRLEVEEWEQYGEG